MLKSYFWIFAAIGLAAQVSVGAEKNKSEVTDDLFAQPQVLQLKLEVPTASLDSLKTDPKKYVRATLKEGSTVYADVGLHSKGERGIPGIRTKTELYL